jgi:Mediator complex protein
VRLRRQVYALEEADIIAPLEPFPSYSATGPRDAGTTTSFGSNASGSTVAWSAGSGGGDEIAGGEEDVAGGPKSGIYGGQGALGVGELNGRVDGVGRDMERELWGQARGMVEGWEKNGDGRGEGKGKGEEGDSMEVDEEAS